MRSNSLPVAWHQRINSVVQYKHPSLWIFIQSLQKEENTLVDYFGHRKHTGIDRKTHGTGWQYSGRIITVPETTKSKQFPSPEHTRNFTYPCRKTCEKDTKDDVSAKIQGKYIISIPLSLRNLEGGWVSGLIVAHLPSLSPTHTHPQDGFDRSSIQWD
jgi:hypothetical protein